LARITITLPDEVVEALAGGDKSALAARLKELAVSTAALSPKIDSLLNQLAAVMLLGAELAECEADDVPGLALAAIQATKALLKTAKGAVPAGGFTAMVIAGLEEGLNSLEGETERLRSGEARREIERVIAEEVLAPIAGKRPRRRAAGGGGRAGIEPGLVSALADDWIRQEKESLRDAVMVAVLQAASVALIIVDGYLRVAKAPEQYGKAVEETASKLKEKMSTLWPGNHHDGSSLGLE